MNDYRWTVRVAFGGVGLLAPVAAIALVLRIFGSWSPACSPRLGC